MGLGGGRGFLRIVSAILALFVLASAATIRVQAENPSLVPAVDCSVQGAAECRGVIFGRTFIDHEDDQTFEPGMPHLDVALEGVEVLLRRNGQESVVISSDANGCYAFTGLEAGTYTIESFPSPLLGLTKLHDEPLEISLPDGETAEVSLRYERLLTPPPPRTTLYFPFAARLGTP